MAALVEGQQYGLSSHDNNSINKTIIFVKLTDSALKSIEEYVRNKSNSILKPSIQFQSNNGVIRLPSNDTHTKSYGFTLSNVETDGPQGSFECLQQGGSKSLESLGCMLLKMHINANEDSYEKTRVKMAAVEKENKKFCTKEIKPSGSYVGRKVKVKRPLSSILSKPSSPPSTIQAPKVAPKVFVNHTSSSFNECNAAMNTERHGPMSKPVKNPEIMKQSCRDRIIHLLALRSYKKPELLAKLFSEGVKEKERRGISAILSQVAVLKGNSYTLASFAWNEVQDTWKFYSKEEAETVRTKKYEMLRSAHENGVSTPSNSPDHSPTQKRTLDEWESNHHDQRGKKQRISHFNRTDNVLSTSECLRPMREDTNFVPISDKSDFDDKKKDIHLNEHRTNANVIGHINNLSQKQHINIGNSNDWTNQRDCTGNGSEKLSPHRTLNEFPKFHLANGDYGLAVQHFQDSPISLEIDQKKQLADSCKQDAMNNENEKHSFDSFQKSINSDAEKVSFPDRSPEKTLKPADSSQILPRSADSNVCTRYYPTKLSPNGLCHNGLSTSTDKIHNESNLQNITSSMNGQLSPNSSNDSSDSIDSVDCDFIQEAVLNNAEYLKEFVKITSRDQRARYKAAFNAEYEEYKALHDKIKCIVNTFSALENQLNGCKMGSLEYFRIKGRIYREYLSNQNDQSYHDAKKRLSFLHGKLSYIKRLVMEYDRAYVASKS